MQARNFYYFRKFLVAAHSPKADVQYTGRIGNPWEFPDEAPVNGHETEQLIFSHGYYTRST